MLSYTIRRLLLMVPVFFGITVMIWGIVTFNPNGGAVAAYLGNAHNRLPVTAAQIHSIEIRLGLDKPLPVRYAIWVGNLFRGDLGNSISEHTTAVKAIQNRTVPTLILMVTAFTLQELLAIPLGIFSALRRGSLFDQIFTVIVYILYSIPTFWFGLMAIVIFGVALRLFPFPGMVNTSLAGDDFGTPTYWAFFHAHTVTAVVDLLQHLAMPALVLAAVGIAGDSRFMRGQMLEVLNQDYVRTAKAKGLPQRTVVWKHALRNAVLPIITNIGLTLPGLIGGAVVTEQIFGWPGMGRLYIQAAGAFDYAVIIGIIVIGAMLTLVFNLLTDLSYALVDPRIRYS